MTDVAGERRVLSLFEQMLVITDDERETWLRQRTGDDAKLRDRLLQLLAAERTIAIRTGAAFDRVAPAAVPKRIGAYRIGDAIGSGGMGTVYLAERSIDDFEHRVAIKLIKPGLFSDALTERFQRERQLLARLNHPHIARLYDGGMLDDGTPYFVMEFVEGSKLVDWVDDHRPHLERRLDLFQQIAEAVRYAHQHLIIHRDLTPANVLVTNDGQAKLIDFGIARSPAGDTDGPGPSAKPDRIATPGYGAPEQLEQAPASTLADIYSLGKILEFLVGRDGNPELDAIVQKAANIDPGARYDGVASLLADIKRYFRAQPVEAFSGRRRYALKKFANRQKFAVTAAIVGALALVAGFAAMLTGFQEARLAQSVAEKQLAETQSMADFLMFDVYDELSRVPGTTASRLLIAENAQTYLNDIAARDSRPSVQLRAGRGLYRLAQVTGGFAPGNAGELRQGLDYLGQSAALFQPLLESRPSDDMRLAAARTEIALMRSKGASYVDIAAAIHHGERALEILGSVQKPSAAVIAAEAEAYRHLGDFLACCSTEPERGIRLLKGGYAKVKAAPAAFVGDPRVRRAKNDLLNLNAGVAILTGGYEDGIPLFRQALAAQSALVDETGQPEDFDLQAVIASNLARTLLHIGRPKEAEKVIAPVHRQALQAVRADPLDNRLQRHLATISLAHAWIAAERGDVPAAQAHLGEGLDYARRADGPGGIESLPSLSYAHHLQEASEAQWALRQTQAACATMREALQMYRDYAETLSLPMTSQRYRVARMEQRLVSCPA
ncbi:serine/threonine protein kinase [Pacificimonas sp. WHA3]|uniref:Serine/threonine protein kinase n=1 Tax=Pacificimonas pallii TaxID=2827236 RepID=A0ABS6SCN6_9SPHN|nr:serine/threonine-protein kinase [Pacificimonas pallii]MBV7256144.1 serine/threonine protein kinase [Pacificimonas pallii]